MGQYHAIPVVVLYLRENLLAVCRREILASGIEYLCHGICLAESVGYLMHVGLEPDNHRLVDNTETLHLVCGDTHYHCLSCTDLMPADASVVLLYHPHGILLGWI